jgi:hypothetical protein
MFCEDPVSGGIKYGQNGIVTIPEVVGLGASIEVEYLKTLTGFTIKSNLPG